MKLCGFLLTIGGAGVSQLIKITDKEYDDLLNDFDPIEAPPHNYKIQPENQGIISVIKSYFYL